MVTMQQIQQGALKFIMEDFSPNCTDTNSKVALGGTGALAVAALPRLAARYKEPLELLGVMQGQLFDIDAAYNAYAPILAGDRLSLALPIIGKVYLTREDFDKLVRYIKEA